MNSATDPLTQRLEIHQVRELVQWSQEFLAKRMRQHKRWQRIEAQRLVDAIIEDVLALPTPAPKLRSLPFEEEVGHANVH